jgi:hypothetical protein
VHLRAIERQSCDAACLHVHDHQPGFHADAPRKQGVALCSEEKAHRPLLFGIIAQSLTARA